MPEVPKSRGVITFTEGTGLGMPLSVFSDFPQA
jgi:hypothetical protein